MLITALLLVVGLGQVQGSSASADPAALVLQLGAPLRRPSVRDRGSRAHRRRRHWRPCERAERRA